MLENVLEQSFIMAATASAPGRRARWRWRPLAMAMAMAMAMALMLLVAEAATNEAARGQARKATPLFGSPRAIQAGGGAASARTLLRAPDGDGDGDGDGDAANPIAAAWNALWHLAGGVGRTTAHGKDDADGRTRAPTELPALLPRPPETGTQRLVETDAAMVADTTADAPDADVIPVLASRGGARDGRSTDTRSAR